MIRTTLVRLDAHAAHASPDFGTKVLGELSPDQVLILLREFSRIDPVDNIDADPEIVLETPQGTRVVHTIQGGLQVSDPAIPGGRENLLGAEEIVDRLRAGDQPDPRANLPEPSAHREDALVYVPPATTAFTLLRPFPRAALAVLALGLAGYLAYPALQAAAFAPHDSIVAIGNAGEIAALRDELAGVYLTGTQPGNHGIALNADGTMKIFQINSQNRAPSFIADTYRFGRIAGVVCAIGRQINEPIRTDGRNRLSFGGEIYARIR